MWLADRPVALIVYTYSGTSTTPLTTTYYSVEADHLGTPRLITDSTQAQRWTWHSAPYGDTLPNEKPGAAAALVYNLRFPGQYFDKEEPHYNWHRDYESTTGGCTRVRPTRTKRWRQHIISTLRDSRLAALIPLESLRGASLSLVQSSMADVSQRGPVSLCELDRGWP